MVGGLVLAVASLLQPMPSRAQEKSVNRLRIAGDASGAPLGEMPSPQGEKYFRLAKGTGKFLVAFDFTGNAATEVQVRVMGAMGTVLQQKDGTYAAPGTYVIEIDNKGSPFQDNEYVINLYLGKERYLADSLQLVIGDASIAPSVADRTAESPLTAAAEPTLAAITDPGAAGSTGLPTNVPGGPSQAVLILAGVGALALLAIVLWAGWSAMGRG